MNDTALMALLDLLRVAFYVGVLWLALGAAMTYLPLRPAHPYKLAGHLTLAVLTTIGYVTNVVLP